MFFAAPVFAQNATGSVGGLVRDTQKQPVAGAKVWLDDQVEGRTKSVSTDAGGHFRFEGIAAGTYMVRVQKSGYRDVAHGPITLKAAEAVTLNLQLAEESSGAAGKNAASVMEYFDEPKFTVAGVSDPSDVGGHGSNVTLPTKEALAKATASLARESPDSFGNGDSVADRGVLPKVGADDFVGNWEAGRELVQSGRPKDAIAYLERARQLRPDAYDADYWLAMAYLRTGEPKRAEEFARLGPREKQTAESHALLAEIKEAEGQPVEAAKEYEVAAQMAPTEGHLFSWGAELLLHHAYEPAAEVFAKGHRSYPRSMRMLVGLGAAAYAQDLNEQAARWLLEASEIDPADPRPYLFLGKVQAVAKSEPPEWVAAFERFARLQPDNAQARYFYAVALEKQRHGEADFGARETELKRAIALDPKLGDAYLELGLLQAERREYPKAVESLQKAVEFTPLPDEAHLRLAQVYREMGETEKARKESELYNDVAAKKKEQLDRERKDLGQFVYTMQGEAAPAEKPEVEPQ